MNGIDLEGASLLAVTLLFSTLVAFNVRGAAQLFNLAVSKMTFGLIPVDDAIVHLYRRIAQVMAGLCTIGVIVTVVTAVT
ncbi:hypothetical protein ABT160_41970 [Streptomyces sp. NPDC001941]|uniref:hypothetical protein n=1 Tax=Streptomyces sp. NPDC001941 TaxID=3154659 RepID=UPI00332A351B